MSQNESVTVVVTRKVKRGRELEYEDWLGRILEDSNPAEPRFLVALRLIFEHFSAESLCARYK